MVGAFTIGRPAAEGMGCLVEARFLAYLAAGQQGEKDRGHADQDYGYEWSVLLVHS